jgi:hypothetical protein
VFLDCIAEADSNDSGPHHRWSTGILYDNTKGYMLRAQNRRASGSGTAGPARSRCSGTQSTACMSCRRRPLR